MQLEIQIMFKQPAIAYMSALLFFKQNAGILQKFSAIIGVGTFYFYIIKFSNSN